MKDNLGEVENQKVNLENQKKVNQINQKKVNLENQKKVNLINQKKKSHQFQILLCLAAITKKVENSLKDSTNCIHEVIKMMPTNGLMNT